MSTISYPTNTRATRGEQFLLAALAGTVLFVITLLFLLIGFELLYLGRIYPGVSIANVDVGGLSPSEAANEINRNLDFPETGRILIAGQNENWLASPAELGLFLDPETAAQNAFKVGRDGNLFKRFSDQFNAWYYHYDLPLTLILDERMAFTYIDHLAQQINTPVVEPSLRIENTDVLIQQGQVGHHVNIEATLDLLTAQMRSLQDGIVPLIITDTHPKIKNVEAQAQLAKSILSEPLKLTMPEDQPDNLGPWVFNPADLAEMIVFESVEENSDTYYEVALSSAQLYSFLSQLAPTLQIEPENPRFIFNDETRQLELIESAIIGRELDIEKSLTVVQEKVLQSNHKISLEFIFTPPTIRDDAVAEDLGITELIHAETSYFFGSSGPRIQNISAAASSFHGVLVAPGETFSMAENLGDISLDNGYAEALIIYGDQTITGVGGGVCQVSTTLFRTAFFSGFPIVERHAHAYRVSYYEKDAGNQVDPRLAGLDATVYVPIVDFKFTNDTEHWLLMETYVNPTYRTIIWKFYSTSDNRTVNWETTGPTHIVEAPEPIYRENPELEKGEVEQVDWEADGADVTVQRTVYRDEEILLKDTFFTHYEPWRAIYEYGPGTEGMPPEKEENSEEDED